MSVALSALSIPIATKRNELGLVEMRELGREKRVTICHQQQCVGSSPFNQKTEKCRNNRCARTQCHSPNSDSDQNQSSPPRSKSLGYVQKTLSSRGRI